MTRWTIELGRAEALPLPDRSVNLVFTSPPYCDARTYGIDAQRDCKEWVEWMLKVVKELTRVCSGLVLVNCAGVTRDHCYWPACEGLLYRWWESGGQCWRPAYWHRVGIPGSGGPQWLRADVEYVLAFKPVGRLPWADNKSNGHPPKWGPGGEMSHRLKDGGRRRIKQMPLANGGHSEQNYVPPEKVNPGNLIQDISVGGGKLGHKLAHDNEAPFPLKLAEWFIRGWCPPNGTVLDPFSGSGTTMHAAYNLGRNSIGYDCRLSQVFLGRKRMRDVESKNAANSPQKVSPSPADSQASAGEPVAQA